MKRNMILRNLGLVLGVLLLLWAARSFWPQTEPDRQGYLKQWSSIDINQIDKVVIEKEDQKVEMVKQGETWRIEGKTVKTETVTEVIKALTQPKEVIVASLTGLKNEELGLSSRSAVLSMMAGEKNQWQVKMGKASMNGRYLSLAGSETVYLVDQVPLMVDSVRTDDWIEKEENSSKAANN